MEEIPDHNKAILLWGPVKGRIIRGEWYKNNKLSRYPIWTKKRKNQQWKHWCNRRKSICQYKPQNLHDSIELSTHQNGWRNPNHPRYLDRRETCLALLLSTKEV